MKTLKRSCWIRNDFEEPNMNRIPIYAAIAALLCCLTGIPVRGDDPQAASQETPPVGSLRVKTELMEVYVVVTDREGRIVEDLKKEDFELLENGRTQEISFFDILQAGTDRRRQDEVSAVNESVLDQSSEVGRLKDRLRGTPARTTLLFVDNLHLSFSSLNWVKQALHRFINEQMTEPDIVALATSHTLGFSQQFTRDRRVLNYAVEQILYGSYDDFGYFSPTLAARVYEEDLDAKKLAVEIIRQQENIPCPCDILLSLLDVKVRRVLQQTSVTRRNTLSILENYAEQMADLPGKRMIVFFSDGFGMRTNDGGFANTELRDVVSRAAYSGVTIYSIDAMGVRPPPTINAAGKWSGIDDPHKRVFIDCIDTCRRLIPPGPERDECLVGCMLQFPQECREIPVPACYPPHGGLFTAYAGEYEQEALNGMHFLAEETGGKLYWGTNNLNVSLQQAFDANRFSYVLSYHVPDSQDRKRIRKIEVRIRNNPGYRIQFPKAYSLSDRKDESEGTEKNTPQQRLLAAMRSPLPVTDLGVSVQADYLETDVDDKQVSLTVYFEGDKFRYREEDQHRIVKLEILSIVEDFYGEQMDGISANVEGNLTEAGMTRARNSGYRFSRRLPLKPGLYHARIGVREEGSDRIGTASTWVEVPEITGDTLEMSSLILSDPLQVESAVEEESIQVRELEQVRMIQGIPVYETDDIFYYTFRVHPCEKNSIDSDLLLRWEVVQGGNSIAADEWTLISEESRNADGKGWFDLDGELDISEFNSGVYELQVSVKEAGSDKAVQRAVAFGIE